MINAAFHSVENDAAVRKIISLPIALTQKSGGFLRQKKTDRYCRKMEARTVCIWSQAFELIKL